jgi:hypothetical protein
VHVVRMLKNVIAIAEVKMTLWALRLRKFDFSIKMANSFCILTYKTY